MSSRTPTGPERSGEPRDLDGPVESLHRDRPAAGIALVCAAIALMASQDAILKWLTAGYATMQILLVRNGVVVFVAAAVVRAEGGAATLRTRRPWGHALRAALNLVTIVLFIEAVARLPLADVMALVMAAPLFTLALSALVLGERVGVRRWSACVAGFAGVLVMLRPGGGAFNVGGLAAMAASLTYSLLVIQTRRLTETEHTGTMMLYGALAFVAVAAVLAPLRWTPPEPSDVGLMVAAGLAVGAGHYLFTQGYRYASPAVLAPFDYTALVWGLLLGWLVWREVPDAATLAGAALVVASGLYILYRETRIRSSGRRAT